MTGSRQQLSTELRHARSQAGLTQHAVAENMDWSPSKLVRIENGSVRISVVDLRALLKLYAIHDTQKIDYLIRLARESKKYSLQKYRDIIYSQHTVFFESEPYATCMSIYEQQVIPGIMQTSDYAKTLMASINLSPPEEAEKIQSFVYIAEE